LGDENGLDLIARLSEGQRLAVVGRFPYLQEVRLNAEQSWVLELQPEGDELPAAAAPDVLPQADVIGITGSTFANGTLEGLLALCRRDAFVAVIGPTTPLSPVLFDYGVSVLCGAIGHDPQGMLEGVIAGGSSRRVSGMRQVSLRPERRR
ncbi:MAG: Rossmann-like domain-containing protein, partial [Chloroflexota bacterium]